MAKGTKAPVFPGFTPLSDRIFVRKGEETKGPKPPSHPRVIVIYGWGDSLPKHILKYAEGFQKLYPHAKQLVVLAPIFQAFLDDISRRSKQMEPIIHEIFPEGSEDAADGSVLFQVMSNTGGVNYAATLNAYRELYGRPMPHVLTVYDSTPGSPVFDWTNLKIWSYAMALGTAAWFPWPFIVTRVLWGMFLCTTHSIDFIMGRETAPKFSKRVFYDKEYETKQASRIFLYSKEDILIPWYQLEQNIADTRAAGYQCDGIMFEGSGHVGHMRMHPEQYWKAIENAWNSAVDRL
ncbi:hypothetical protein NM208_g918 [Fusarium decemcellulare]|uniref:Uncharacterized protein n=1 Tax=Fusarium decemcellulare TaxID=57161 RepID=A0ACC1SXP9_9HYPO|nr:hypothetical protein NM208_g918 [Fusarium decemcellulare]